VPFDDDVVESCDEGFEPSTDIDAEDKSYSTVWPKPLSFLLPKFRASYGPLTMSADAAVPTSASAIHATAPGMTDEMELVQSFFQKDNQVNVMKA
jgi:hypothetical protein